MKHGESEMRRGESGMLTPLYLKTRSDMPWPEDEPVFYLLTADGLFLCRNHRTFRSSVPAPRGPSELAPHEPFLRLRFPKIPRALLETVVGFFARVGEEFGAEAGALIVWDETAGESGEVRCIVPNQIATVRISGSGWLVPESLIYDTPTSLPAGVTVIGDIHSHVDLPAYASNTDQQDEVHRAGLHVVVGRIRSEPPEFHCEFVVDGARFRVEPKMAFAGYRRRRDDMPTDWLDRVDVRFLDDAPPAYGAGAASDVAPRIIKGGTTTGWGKA